MHESYMYSDDASQTQNWLNSSTKIWSCQAGGMFKSKYSPSMTQPRGCVRANWRTPHVTASVGGKNCRGDLTALSYRLSSTIFHKGQGLLPNPLFLFSICQVESTDATIWRWPSITEKLLPSSSHMIEPWSAMTWAGVCFCGQDYWLKD